jgi:hypothetical protein
MNRNNGSNGTHGWYPYDEGKTIGIRGTEGGTIARDEEHGDGARITLERDTLYKVPFAITCGIYSWMVHTRFFADEPTALDAYDQMKHSIADILALLAGEVDSDTVSDAIDAFVEQYP